MIWKNADFRSNSTGLSDYRRHFPLALLPKYTSKGTYHPVAPTLTSSHCDQMFTESVDLMACVAMVYRGKYKDWVGPWMTFCELPTITVGMSLYMYMHSLLFRYLDWNQSCMMQIAEVYDIQIDLNSKWVWRFRLINSFPAYHHFLQKHSLSKLNSLIMVWTYLICPTSSEITKSHRKFHSISRILTLILFVISTKTYSKYHFHLQPSHFWSWCSEFYSIFLLLCGLAISVSTCRPCCHGGPCLYPRQGITVTF